MTMVRVRFGCCCRGYTTVRIGFGYCCRECTMVRVWFGSFLGQNRPKYTDFFKLLQRMHYGSGLGRIFSLKIGFGSGSDWTFSLKIGFGSVSESEIRPEIRSNFGSDEIIRAHHCPGGARSAPEGDLDFTPHKFRSSVWFCFSPETQKKRELET